MSANNDIEREPTAIPFRVVIEMEHSTVTNTAALKIVTQLPDPMALALVHSAFMELFSKKVRQDIKDESRIVQPRPGGMI